MADSRQDTASGLTFWGHLDVLRGVIIRLMVAVGVCAVGLFCVKEWLFRLVLAPQRADFPTWRLLDWLGFPVANTEIPLINTELAQQFLIHIEMAAAVGCLLVSPYILYEIIRFINPALYEHERRAALPAVLAGWVMFVMGVLLAYFVLFPFTFVFLGTYQVADNVSNMITLRSYISAMLIMCLTMGVVFELPILCGLLGRLGLLKSAAMRKVRKHALVVILIMAAVITPTGDAFTLILVSLPICLLYEVSIWVVKHREK